jgi:glc operon protein GlcG
LPLNFGEAQAVVTAAHAHAGRLGIKIAVAVVDEGGFLLALGRMDGAPPLASGIAEAKAVGAALWHRDGDQLAKVHADRSKFFEQVDKMVRLPMIPGLGSLQIKREQRVLGAVGVSGGIPEQDLECAQAGLESIGS